MSDKSQRYIGLVIWAFTILVFWFFDEGDFWGRLKIEIDPVRSPAVVIARQILSNNFSFSYGDTKTLAEIFWLVSLPIALYFAWRFRAAPASLIIKLGRAFHKRV
jgi:hypothetical protein